MGFGKPHRHFTLTDSTNQRARELAAAGAPSGTVVTAAEQSAGRGRQGRRWSAPRGSALLYSAILRPLGLEHALLPLAVPLAVCEACEEVAAVGCRIKWPNDIWVDERKLAGVLIEARPPEWAVIGVGVNVSIELGQFPSDLRWPAISLGAEVDGAPLRDALNRRLADWVEAPPERVRRRFSERDALIGRSLAWEGGPAAADGSRHGVGDGIDERGNLMVVGAAGERLALGSGEVHLRIG